MVNFKFLKDHGTNKKGSSTVMAESTAKALVAHKVGEITSKVKAKKK